MKLDFSLSYNSQMEYNEIGYHTTFKIYKQDIITTGFKPSIQKNDWLGEGVYFWDNENNAYWWNQNSKLIEKCIFVCNLTCQSSNYLNLDNKNEMKKFVAFSKKYIHELSKHSKKKPNFTNNDETRKFFCDIYCSNNNISILSFTFEHNIIKFGFKVESYKRRQICVRDTNCISIINIKE